MSARDPFPGAPDLNRPAAGRHRAPVSAAQRILYHVVAPLAAVAVVAAVIVVLVVVRGHSSGSGPGAGVITAPTHTPVVIPSGSTSPRITPTKASPTHPAPTPPLRPTRPPASRTAKAPVRVYNTTHITGLAHHVAAEIAQRGWTVPAVGNVSNSLPATTLYYSPSTRAAAQHLAREFSGIRRVAPNTSLGVHYRGLTLLLTADWHD